LAKKNRKSKGKMKSALLDCQADRVKKQKAREASVLTPLSRNQTTNNTRSLDTKNGAGGK